MKSTYCIVQLLQPRHRIPYHTRKAVSKEVEKLIVDRYNTTSYRSAYPLDISHSICTKETLREKDGGTRMFAAMRQANNANIRERHMMPS